jgi:hypothetical protein
MGFSLPFTFSVFVRYGFSISCYFFVSRSTLQESKINRDEIVQPEVLGRALLAIHVPQNESLLDDRLAQPVD